MLVLKIYCRPTGWLYSLVRMGNLTTFEGCHFSWFYILIWSSFRKIETENFNSDPCFFNLVKLGTISLAAHFLNCAHIGRSQLIEELFFQSFFWKTLRKVNRFWEFLTDKQRKNPYRDNLKSRYRSLFVLLFLLTFTCIL